MLLYKNMFIYLYHQKQTTMKELCFNIATKIATDKSENTVYLCCSVLKDAFIMQGFSNKVSNEMAIDTIKIIMKTMLNLTK